MYRNILVESADGVAVITLNRPEQMNPLDHATVKELLACFAALERDAAVRVVIITGAGKAFSAGGDLGGYLTLYRDPPRFRAFLEDIHDLLLGFERSERIVVAAVNGWCLAGGIELMLACDLVVAADAARIGDAHLNYAQLPGAGGSQRLPRAIGVPRAKDLILSARWVDGADAQRLGLVARVVPAAELMAEARGLAAAMVERSPAGLSSAKYLINEGMKLPVEQALRFEIDVVHRYATTCPDAMEGLAAFQEKRKPRFG